MGGTKASVKIMLTAWEKQRLAELGYHAHEVEDMRLEMAARVLERNLRRPWGKDPMPQTWRKPRGGLVKGGGVVGSLIRLAVYAGAAYAAYAAATGKLSGPPPRPATRKATPPPRKQRR